jgi:tetratricopeptide (TPR) repeat protein
MNPWLKRGITATFATVYAAVAAWVYLSQPAPAGSPSTEVRKPLRWAKDHPLIWQQLGRNANLDPTAADATDAETDFFRAAKANPMEPSVWTDLADTYLQKGSPREAEAALRTAVQVYPRSPAIAWRLANSLILEGRVEDALPLLKTVAASDHDQQRAVYDLAWKVLDSSDAVLEKVVPSSLDARVEFLYYVIYHRPDAAPNVLRVWQELSDGQRPETVALGNLLIERLLFSSHTTKEAAQLWTRLLAFTGRSAAQPEGALMSNGDFELDLPGDGLDWQLKEDPHWTATLDNFQAHKGTRSLQLAFDGKSNPFFDGLWQWVVVEPNTNYRLQAFVKTDNVISDSGPRLFVQPANGESPTLYGPMHLGSEAWLEDTVAFHTAPTTTLVRIGLIRIVSQKLYGQLGGKIWLDDFRLETTDHNDHPLKAVQSRH